MKWQGGHGSLVESRMSDGRRSPVVFPEEERKGSRKWRKGMCISPAVGLYKTDWREEEGDMVSGKILLFL